MRCAINNLQATVAGFGTLNDENVFKVCDQPDPVIISSLIGLCIDGKVKTALAALRELYEKGYCATDLISTIFRVCKTYNMNDTLRLAFIKQVAEFHLRISEGLDTIVQLSGLVSSLSTTASEFTSK